MATINTDPRLWLAIGQGLTSGTNTAGQISGLASSLTGYQDQQAQQQLTSQQQQQALQAKQLEAQRKNETLQALMKTNPELAQAVKTGAISANDAFVMDYKQRAEAKKPRNMAVVQGKDGVFYQYDQRDPKGTMTPLNDKVYQPNSEVAKKLLDAGIDPKSPEGQQMILDSMKTGWRVTTGEEGTTIEQGNISSNQPNQKIKNDANRLKDIQDQTALASDLKQTASYLREANKNTGYSGPGAGLYGAVADTAEQMFGKPVLWGTAAARATMDSQSLNIVLGNVQKTKGAVSDSEMRIFNAASPGMGKTPQGNKALIDIADAIADRVFERGKRAEEWYGKYGNLDGFENNWAEYITNNPLIAKDATSGMRLLSSKSSTAETNTTPSSVNKTSTNVPWKVHQP